MRVEGGSVSVARKDAIANRGEQFWETWKKKERKFKVEEENLDQLTKIKQVYLH